MVFSKLAKVMIQAKHGSFNVYFSLWLTDRWFDRGAYPEACQGDGDGGAVINHSVFAKQNQFSTSGSSCCGHGLPQ